MLEALGVDVECDVSVVKRSIETAGIGIFNGMSPKVHPTALGRILSQIRFGTILNISASLANPALPKIGARGVYSKEMLMPTVEVMKDIGFQRAMVFHGLNDQGTKGMDEMSTLGRTMVVELGKTGAISAYQVTPKDLGIAVARESDLLVSSDRDAEVLRFLRLLSGQEAGPRQDIVCLNAAPVLCMMGHADGLKAGVERARSLIENGKAFGKLQDWIKAQNADPSAGMERLNGLMARADAPA
jgi:anthranilate phosphoribosyltransferase